MPHLTTPTPNPSPQGGREYTAFVARLTARPRSRWWGRARLRDQKRLPAGVISDAEIDHPVALARMRHRGCDEIDVAADQERDTGGRSDLDELDRNADARSYLVDEIDVETRRFVLLVE